ncbi:MAG: ATP-binding protein [Pseudomonadota bacterium]
MGTYRTAVIVFLTVSALTLFSFYISWIHYSPDSSQIEGGGLPLTPWLILVGGVVVAVILAAYLVNSTRQQILQEQMRSDRNKLENLLVSARKIETMAQLVGSIAHDFNNILMTVSGYASLALAKNEDKHDPEMQEYLSLVSLSADRGTNLMKKLLSFSRGKSHRRSNRMELLPAVENTLNLLGQVLPHELTVQIEIAENLPALQVDSLTLEQIVTNLVINARDAIEGEGTISISLVPTTTTDSLCNACQQVFTGEFVCLSVSDTGKGLMLDNIDDIFQPFYTTKNEGKGAGLGMALLQNLVHSMGGHIQLASTRGTGTTVTIFLPLPAPLISKVRSGSDA